MPETLERQEARRKATLKAMLKTYEKFFSGDRTVPHFQIKDIWFQPIQQPAKTKEGKMSTFEENIASIKAIHDKFPMSSEEVARFKADGEKLGQELCEAIKRSVKAERGLE